MAYPRASVSGGPVGLTLELPPGLFRDKAGEATPGAGQTLAVFRSIVDGPALIIGAFQAGAAASLVDVLSGRFPGFIASNVREAFSGGPSHSHVGLAWREEGGGWVRSRLAVESGGMVLLGCAEAPSALWDDYGTFAERAMMTVQIDYPTDPPTLALQPGGNPPLVGGPVADPEVEQASRKDAALRAAEAAAAAMIARGDDAQAIARVQSADSDIRGANVLARLFEAALAAAVDAARADALYARAREWGWRSLPSPQTAVEGEQHSEALAEIEARLASLRGRGPA